MSETLRTVTDFLRAFAPLDLAESWDNVGLLLGETEPPVRRAMTCLTLSPDVAAEAIAGNADFIVSHHPVLFRPIQKLTSDSSEGPMLLSLIRHGIRVYSPHTAFDSAQLGINQQLADALDLRETAPIRPQSSSPDNAVGSGRRGQLPRSMSFGQFLNLVRTKLKILHLQYVGDVGRPVSSVAVACGSAGEFLSDAVKAGCDVFLTGEARFHSCLEAREKNIALVLAGHYATERPAVETLAQVLKQQFPQLQVWASEQECDPVLWSLGS
ncbi:Nif3-like dinuclear metal center hexameric protein [Planctomicrobium piriforme]|uniref:GTP cyclohydrolase 1 type 2 homolog n=1 Tax=Planctomicrobium piriforme TaxID=1576369 RepID=A0A1I3DMF9_9PLAN|nr:Nif3-like dinuclear metal center hexameric protein [Planctomicrobium piriforme]SFH87886.1 dinuclear metal center protein, YbgI/SA1388 family [Planctomicrobium piriforme]